MQIATNETNKKKMHSKNMVYYLSKLCSECYVRNDFYCFDHLVKRYHRKCNFKKN